MENQTTLALTRLTHYQPRQFLSESADLAQPETAIEYYMQLLDTPLRTVDETNRNWPQELVAF